MQPVIQERKAGERTHEESISIEQLQKSGFNYNRAMTEVTIMREILEAGRLLAPILGNLSIQDGEIFPRDDYNRRRKLIPVEAKDFTTGVLKLLKAFRKTTEAAQHESEEREIEDRLRDNGNISE